MKRESRLFIFRSRSYAWFTASFRF